MKDVIVFAVTVVIYLAVIGYLGYLGYKGTKTSGDFMIAGRQIHPYVMALSYGATFISTSAIVGFGGAAGVFGMGILWLTFLNIGVGIAIAFILFGKRTRTMGVKLDAHTFPEFLGRRYDSKAIQIIGGLVIFIFMPLYTGVVLVGAAKFIEGTVGKLLQAWFTPEVISTMPILEIGLAVFSVIVAIYVIAGGLKGVMFADALQGTIMFIGMVILLTFIYRAVGGFVEGHQALTNLASKIPENMAAAGHQGWTAMPILNSPYWWTLVSTIVLGVGIGVLAQPQLVVRFMTVKSNRELNRAVLVGGIFILFMTGVAFIVGSLSNVYFFNETGNIAIVTAQGNSDSIIPLLINSAMPSWFGVLFMLTLLAAAMSTISSQFHAMGTALSRDIVGSGRDSVSKEDRTRKILLIAKIGIVVEIIISVLLAYIFKDAGFIARGTAIFFGICAAVFLPMYILGLYWKRTSKAAALSGMVIGLITSIFWIFFINAKNASEIGLLPALTGKASLLGHPWNVVDPIIIAFPVAFIVTLIVTAFTRPVKSEITDKLFAK